MAFIEKISRKLKKEDKTALILSGGGMTGWMYEIGALTAINDLFVDDFSVCDFDMFIGTSAGSSIASLLANGVNPEGVLNSIINNEDVPFNFTRKDIYSFDWTEAAASVKKFTKSIIPLLKYYYQNKNRFSTLDFIYLLQENLPSGIFSLANLDTYIKKSFLTMGLKNDFALLNKKLYIPATDIDTGKSTIFGEEGQQDVPISTAVAASSAIPLIFHPVRIKGNDYVDGSVGRVAYINIAVNNGASFVITINPVMPINNDRKTICIPSFHGKCVGLKDKGLSFVADQVLRVNAETKLYLSMKLYKAAYKKRDFFLLQPPRTEVEMFSYNIMSLHAKAEVLNYGYFSTVRMIMKQFDEMQKGFERFGIKVSLEKFKEENRTRWEKMQNVNKERRALYESLKVKKKKRFF